MGELLGDRRQNLVLVERLVLVARRGLADLAERERAWEARKVVELRRERRLLVVHAEVDKELRRVVLVRCELPDVVAPHHVLETEAPVRPDRDRPDRELVGEGEILVFRRPR